MAIGTNNCDLFVGTEGADEYFALGGAGADLLVATHGDIFAGGAIDAIIGFSIVHDAGVIDPNAAGIDSLAEVQAALLPFANAAGSGTSLALGGGNAVELYGVVSAALTADNFHFAG